MAGSNQGIRLDTLDIQVQQQACLPARAMVELSPHNGIADTHRITLRIQLMTFPPPRCLLTVSSPPQQLGQFKERITRELQQFGASGQQLQARGRQGGAWEFAWVGRSSADAWEFAWSGMRRGR